MPDDDFFTYYGAGANYDAKRHGESNEIFGSLGIASFKTRGQPRVSKPIPKCVELRSTYISNATDFSLHSC
jgi:hypothetical protein